MRKWISWGLTAVLVVAVAGIGCEDISGLQQLQPEDGLQASAGGWDDMVTGGGEASAGGVVFHFSVSAKHNDGNGVPGEGAGEMEYWRDANGGAEALSVHADVTCLWVATDESYAAMAGPIKTVQEDPAGQLDGDTWIWAEVKEGGTSSGDEVRFRGMTSGPGSGSECGQSGSTPGVYTDGNISIRSK